MLAGLFMTPALVGIYARLRETDAAFALWMLIIGFFGFVGLSVLFIAWLVEGGRFPRALGYWGYALGVLSIWVYLARLIVVDAASLLLAIPTLWVGFIFGSVWFIWLGIDLQRRTMDERAAATAQKPDLHRCGV